MKQLGSRAQFGLGQEEIPLTKLERILNCQFDENRDPFPHLVGKYADITISGVRQAGLYHGITDRGHLVFFPGIIDSPRRDHKGKIVVETASYKWKVPVLLGYVPGSPMRALETTRQELDFFTQRVTL